MEYCCLKDYKWGFSLCSLKCEYFLGGKGRGRRRVYCSFLLDVLERYDSK